MFLRTLVKFVTPSSALLLLVALAPAGRAQVSGQPLEKDIIINLLKSHVDAADVARPAHEFGINFATTPQIEAELRKAGADQATPEMDKLIRVLRGMALGQVDILGLLVETESSQYLARLVRKRGIDFVVSEDFLKQLGDAGGEKALEAALRSAIVVSNPRPSAAQQLEAQLVQHVYQGSQFEKKHEFVKAETEYRAALTMEKRNPVLQMVLGHLLLLERKNDESEAEFRAALRLWPSSPPAHSNVGASLFAKGSFDSAIAEQRAAILRDPDYADGHGNLGTELVQRGDFDAGVAELREALRIDPERVSWRIQLDAALMKKDERLDEAIADLRDLIRSKPENVFARVVLGQALDRKKDWDYVIEEEKAALRLDPNLPMAHVELGNALVMKNEFDQAIPEYRSAVRLEPDAAIPHFLLGLALEHQKDLQPALDELAKARKLDAKDSRIQEAYDRIQKALTSASAESASASSAAADSITVDELVKLDSAQKLLNAGQLNEAVAKLQELLRRKPNYADAHKVLGMAFGLKKDWDNDIAEEQAALRLNSTLAQAHLELGVALAWKNGWDQTVTELRAAVQLAPADAQAHALLGVAYEHQQDHQAAGDEYGEANQLVPKDRNDPTGVNGYMRLMASANSRMPPLAPAQPAGVATSSSPATEASSDAAAKRHIQAALDYLTKNDLENALFEATSALHDAPKSAEAHHLLGQIYERTDRLQDALGEYSQARDLDPHDPTIQIAYDRVQNALAHPAASPASSGAASARTSASAGPDKLEGIYVATEKGGTGYARWYYFKPSGAVAVECDQNLVDPDEALSWPTITVYVEVDAEKRGYKPTACALGQYQVQGNQVRFDVYSFWVDVGQHVKFRVTARYGQSDRRDIEGLQTVRGFDLVQIVQPTPIPNYTHTWNLFRQSDQTGKTLEGEYSNLVLTAPVGAMNTGQTGTAKFTADGQFSISVQTSWEGNAAAQPKPGGSTGSGTYELQEHTIIFHNADGTVSVRNFGYLGKDERGREFIAIGGFFWVKGNILSE